jgi:hypothetical protein
MVEANMKQVDFLDITMDLNTGTFKPFMKLNNNPLYVHKDSNHPPSIIRNIPLAVNRRLSSISSNKEIFDTAAKTYQEALNKGGYSHKLSYEVSAATVRPGRCRNRRVSWFNPPFCKSVATDIAKEFLKLIDSCFPPGHPLRSGFNRNTVKASYRTMPNMAQIVSKHNTKVLDMERPKTTEDEGCNCRVTASCPLDGKCKTTGVVYQATVTAPNSAITPTETYTGLTGGMFKARFTGHMSSMRHRSAKTDTTLSHHIWDLKDADIAYNITWKILDRGRGYNQTSKSCRLCLLEKHHIMFNIDGASLNRRSEIFSSCRHRAKLRLGSS